MMPAVVELLPVVFVVVAAVADDAVVAVAYRNWTFAKEWALFGLELKAVAVVATAGIVVEVVAEWMLVQPVVAVVAVAFAVAD